MLLLLHANQNETFHVTPACSRGNTLPPSRTLRAGIRTGRAEYMLATMGHLPTHHSPRRRGFSLFEVVLVLAIVSVLMALSVPSFRRATEQSHADIAAANLRAIWSAQRFYWLENRQYADDFSDLQSLLDPSITASAAPYSYAITVVDSNTFTAKATRTGSSKWTGQVTIDQTGAVTGSIQARGEITIIPGFQ